MSAFLARSWQYAWRLFYVPSLCRRNFISVTIQRVFTFIHSLYSEKLFELYNLVEDFRNHYRRTEALKPSSSHSGFATLREEPKEVRDSVSVQGSMEGSPNGSSANTFLLSVDRVDGKESLKPMKRSTR